LATHQTIYAATGLLAGVALAWRLYGLVGHSLWPTICAQPSAKHRWQRTQAPFKLAALGKVDLALETAGFYAKLLPG
jgi:hypothetical protein